MNRFVAPQPVEHILQAYFLTFDYDVRGYGMLTLRNNSLLLLQYMARTGTLGLDGCLTRALQPGKWSIRGRAAVIDTRENGMWVTHPSRGWKARMWSPGGQWTRFLIHPDGGRPGTLGCIGIQNTDATELRDRLRDVLRIQGEIAVRVNMGPVSSSSSRSVSSLSVSSLSPSRESSSSASKSLSASSESSTSPSSSSSWRSSCSVKVRPEAFVVRLVGGPPERQGPAPFWLVIFWRVRAWLREFFRKLKK
jgi:hypothetical protein